jgi:xanthine dehydrogenase accessory factor
VTRGHVHDQACLEEILDGPAAYIGMIGSRRRVQTVMAHAKEAGHDPELLKRVHAPVGLDINAHTPAEIALSIMAEIVNVRRGGRAPSMAMGKRLRV